MKNILLLCAISFGLSLSAQISITSASFPVVGDSLQVLTDLTVDDIIPTAPGPDQIWDYTALESGFLRTSVLQPAEEGEYKDSYPNAEAYIEIEAGFENYLELNDDIVGDWGFFGGSDQTDFLQVTAKYTEPYILQRAPLDYEDNNTFETSLRLPEARENLPDSLLEQIPPQITFDSIRIRIEIEQTSTVDAWGELNIPGATYEVLRDRRYEIRDTRIDTKLGFFGWQDATAFIEPFLPGVVGIDTVIYEYFVAEESLEPVLVLELNTSDEVVQAVYKYEGILTSTVNLSTVNPDFIAYPNPAIDKVTIEARNLKSGDYTVRIFDLLGKDTYKAVHYFQEDAKLEFDISSLSKGTYFYSILDSSGKPIKTKRLMVIRP